MRIWKWKLEVTDIQTLELPTNSAIMTVQMQNGWPQLWALCDDTIETKDRRDIAIYGTGNPMPDEAGDYIATFQMLGGGAVFHAFEVEHGRDG